MKVIITGGRDFSDRELVYLTLDRYSIDELIHGGCSGADQLAAKWARHCGRMHHIVVKEYPALWDRYGRKAGPLRNNRMLAENPDAIVIAFPGGKGTKHMVEEATDRGFDVRIASAESFAPKK